MSSMNNAVVKSASYVLVHTPDMILHNGTTQTTEKLKNPESEYIKNIKESFRAFEDVVNYAPNQTYIGNINPEELSKIEMPWFDKKLQGAKRTGRFGEIMPQDEFIALIKIADAFNLVLLNKKFTESVKERIDNHPLFKDEVDKLGAGVDLELVQKCVNEEHAEAIYHHGKLIGCVKKAHDIDLNLSAHVIFENLVVKASGALAFNHLIEKSRVPVEKIDYVIECSEEACGDMNQRGGGNFAKSIAEMCGAVNATGSDTRGFCAAPLHALTKAAALVKSGVYSNVVIVAGGQPQSLE